MVSERRQCSYVGWSKALVLDRAAGGPCPAPPTPCLGRAGAPRGHQTIAGLLQEPAARGHQAQLEQHSCAPDWPGELLQRVMPGKPTGSVNNWRVLAEKKEKKKASQLIFHSGARLMLSALG